MPHELTLNLEVFLAVCGGLITVGGAAAVLHRWFKPLMKPLEKLDERIGALENRNKECSEFFDHDKKQLEKHEILLERQEEDMKMLMKSVALLLVHAETGNHTGEVREGRMELEEYLIDR